MVKDRHCTFSGALGLCEGARVQRGESSTARCASTGVFRVFPLPAALAERAVPNSSRLSQEEWPGCPVLRASDEHIFVMLPPRLLVLSLGDGG